MAQLRIIAAAVGETVILLARTNLGIAVTAFVTFFILYYVGGRLIAIVG